MVEIFLMLLALVLSLPVLFLLIQVLAAILGRKARQTKQYTVRPSVMVLMPAHNEALVIGEAIQSILPQLATSNELLVVADNCNDDTAAIARALGVNVIERSHKTERGKGYALDFGLQHLKKNPPRVVVIVDADCYVSAGALGQLLHACEENKRPIQSLYLMRSQPSPSLKARIAEFAWLVKNKVRPLGLKTLGMPCQLMGTGMAFLWEDIASINLASGHIVEDMKLGIDLTRAKRAPLFLPEATVMSMFPPTEEAKHTQRTRWEHGHLSVIINEVPALLYESIITRNGQLLALACDLVIPPLAVLSLLCFTLFVLCFVWSSQWVLLMALILLTTLLAAVLLAWLFFGRDSISFRQLCYAPIYALIKIPLYVKFFVNRQVEWVRSKRD
jgi:cellulose synthase/poly-beta-1,6-N-acetylglucosamine synthase-like glycosyltransferase